MDETLNDFNFQNRYYIKPLISTREKTKNFFQWNNVSFQSITLSLLPILSWLPKYSFRNHLPGDIIGGVTTAIIRIPQSLAYGLLAGLDPINGVYTAFFSPLIYAFLGTSKHVSVGTFAVISLMLGNAQEKVILNKPCISYSSGNESFATIGSAENSNCEMYKLSIVASLTLLIGLIQIFLGFLRLGFVSLLLSDPLISGFTTGAAVYVVAAQIKYFFGISLKRHSSPFSVFKLLYELISRITETNPAEILVSFITIVVLYPVKLINIKYKKQLHNIPIPMELIIVVAAAIISYFCDLNTVYKIEIVGYIPRGLPTPYLPSISHWLTLINDAFSIAIVSFAITVSIGKLFAKKHDYKIDPNQELFALGTAQLGCAFFRGHACSGALARSSVKESSGAKTQFSDFVSSAVILLILLVLGPYLKSLPTACLSAIIVVNIRTLFLQFLQLSNLWKICISDFSVWIVTFVATIVLGVDAGLIIGIFFLLCIVTLQRYFASIQVLGEVHNTGVYRNINNYKQAAELNGIKIVKIQDAPFFANVAALNELMKEILLSKKDFTSKREVPRPPIDLSIDESVNTATKKKSANVKSTRLDADPSVERQSPAPHSVEMTLLQPNTENTSLELHTLIFDCSCWFYVDSMGLETLKQICNELKKQNICIMFGGLDEIIFNKLVQLEILTPNDKLTASFPTLTQAIAAARKQSDSRPKSIGFDDDVI